MGANNQYTISLKFSADASQAKKDINNLVNELNQLAIKSQKIALNGGLSDQFRQAAKEVTNFTALLQNAVNINTGKLDLSKLDMSLKKSNLSLEKVATSFKGLGNDGVKAFSNVVNQINAAEVPIKKTNAMVDKMWTSLKNAVNWQISSSAIHAMVGGIQTAYNYAEDLNRSLNDIRIVTGQNVEQMDKFAEKANKAAKALSATTLDYTNASLIYYQQGLSDKEVADRTAVTIKMANATGVSAATVSDQLTAVWNNFYDGSKSLEYYADVMTALGAATASSTDEISEGLEKFASVAETVGLSYEYATAALATVTATTRQSADVVGTAFKTLFARLQDLELGDTLDDGTTLGQYSEALNKVGINIKDTNGEMKDMDDILDELGAKWTTLSKSTQVALAQTVAGTRQYTQLVSLMDNWSYFQENLGVANNATGALQEQADIYADSWEAAQKRVQAAAEDIYTSIIDDDFFIGILNVFEKFLSTIKNLIDGLGGLKGVLGTITTYILTIAKSKISEELIRLTGPSQAQKEQQAIAMKIKANEQLAAITKVGSSEEAKATANAYTQVARIQKSMLQNAGKLSEEQQVQLANQLDTLKVLNEMVIKRKAMVDLVQKETNAAEKKFATYQTEQTAAAQKATEGLASINAVTGSGHVLNRKGKAFSSSEIDQVNQALTQSGNEALTAQQVAVLSSGAEKGTVAWGQYSQILKDVNAKLLEAKIKMQEIANQKIDTQDLTHLKEKLKEIADLQVGLATDTTSSGEDYAERAVEGAKKAGVKHSEEEWKTIQEHLAGLSAEERAADATATQLADDLFKVSQAAAEAFDEDHQTNVGIFNHELVQAQKEAKLGEQAVSEMGEGIRQGVEKGTAKLKPWQDQLVACASAVSAVSSALSALGGLWNTYADPDLSVWEKITTTFTTLGTVIPMVVMAWKALSDAKVFDTIVTGINTAASWANAEAKEGEADANKDAAEAQIKETATDIADTAGGLFKIIETGLGTFFKTIKTGLTKTWKIFKSIWTAIKGVVTKFGTVVGAVAIAAAVIYTSVKVFNVLSDAYNKNEIAAQKAEAAAKDLSNTYTEAKGEYEDLKNTISSYSSAKDGLSELTRGTAEFAEQISSANNEALKLLDTYGDLIGNRYSVNSDGLISINEEALEEIQQQELDKTLQAQSASVIANQRARELRAKADATEMHRKTVKTSEGWTSEDSNITGQGAAIGTGVGAGAGAAIGIGSVIASAGAGALAGSPVPIVGTIIGAIAGLVVGAVATGITTYVANNSETDREKEALATLAENYHELGESALTADKIKEAYGADLTEEEISAIRDLCKEMNANTVATEAENQAMANSILADNEVVQNSRDVDDVAVFAGAAYGKTTDEAMEKYLSDDYKANFWGVGSDAQKDAWQRYAKEQGLSDLKDYKVTNYRKDGGVTYSYTDDEGETQEKTVTQDEWAAVLAAQDANSVVEQQGEEIVKILAKLQEGTVDILTGAKSGDMSGLTMGQLSGDLSEIQSMSESDLQALGFEGSKEEILAKIAEQQQANIDNIKLNANTYGETLSTLVSDMIDSNDSAIQNVTQGTLKAYTDTLHELATHGGNDVMQNFNEGMTGLLDKYSNKTEEIMSIANDIDWSSGEKGLQEFNYQLLKMGINIDENSDEWQQLVKAVSGINVSIVERDLDSIRTEIVEIKNLCKDITIGSIVSDDDYDKLIKYKAELADLFIMTADGYRYIGGEDLESVVGESALAALKKTKDDNDKIKQSHANLNRWGWTDGENWTKEDWYGLANGYDSDASYTAMTNALIQNNAEDINNLGFNTDRLLEAANVLSNENTTDEQKKSAREELQDFYAQIIEMNNNFEDGLYENSLAEEVYASTATSIAELNDMAGNLDEGKGSAAYTKQLQYLTNAGIAAAESLSELHSIVSQGLENGATVNYNDYAAALQRIAGNYSNTEAELARYQTALESGDLATIKAAESQLEAAISAGEMAEKYGLTAEHIERYADELAASGKYSKANEKSLTEMAKDQLRYDNAVISAQEHMETWIADLKVAAKTGHLVTETADQMAEAYGNLLDIDGSELSATFLNSEENLKLMQEALNGSDEAYRQLQENAGKDILSRLNLDTSQWDADLAMIEAQVQDFTDMGLADIEAGATLNDEGFLQALTEMVNAAGMTAQEATDYLSSMGIDAEVVNQTETVPETQAYNLVATTGTTSVPYNPGASSDGATATYPYVTYEAQPVTVDKTITSTALEVTSASKSSGGSIKKSGSTPVNGGSNKKSGGGGSKPKKVDLTKKSDVVDRYKEINDAIEDNSQAMDKASKAADRLYGEARLKKMREVNGLIQQEISLNKQKREEALKYLATDKADLQDAAKAAGVSFTFDEDGDITNYTDQMTKLWEELHAAQVAANADGNADEDEQEAIQKIQDKIDAVSEAVDQYEETKSLIEDLDDEIQEQIYEWQDNNLELLQQEIELKIEINEDELEWLEYLLKRAESDVYKIAEAFSYLTQKQDISLKNLETYNQGLTDTYDKATKVNPETGLYDLSQSDAIEELKELKSNIINELSTLLDLDADALAYYGDALASISEEVEKYTSQFDDLNTTLDHYNTLLELTGQSKNYKAMDKILSAQADVAKNQAAIAKRQYETYANEVNDWKSKMEAAQAAGDEAAYELYKKNYEAAYENMAAAQDDMYTKTEEWLEDMKALYENKLADLGEQLEKALTGGISFDELTTAMERSSSLQEEYLTTTNQIYETNKLMRQAQQEIDKTTNSVAKKKLAAYIQETEQLQNQSKLSNYELEIQQAKYDLLLAEIALEEAQQAKSTVRLQRDSEGNLGYVYTADADKIANAEQELADKQNALYNIGLEGANDYAEKYSQTMQEMYETLSELHQQYLDGEFASEEEYNNAVAAAKEYYYQKLEDYSSLYKVALTTDSRVIKDAWSSDYNDMIYKVEELKDSIENYLSESKSVLSSWSQDVKFAIEESGLGDMEQAVKNVTDASKGLNDYLTGEDGLLDTMDKEIEKVNAATTAYALERDAILDLAKAYEKAIKQANEYIKIIEKTDNTAEQKKTDLNIDTSTADTSSNETAVEKTLSTGSTVKVKTSAKKFASGQYMASFVPGGTYTVMNINGEKVLIGKGGSATGWVYKSDLEGFDTGGYTGEWGSYGKLAMLHQKELVLNAGDTENFLASMEVLDHILEIIDLQSASSRLGGLLSSPTIGNNDSVIEQHIDIHAEFPNATSHSEIEEAFNNLINQASQYANRK